MDNQVHINFRPVSIRCGAMKKKIRTSKQDQELLNLLGWAIRQKRENKGLTLYDVSGDDLRY